MSNMSFKQLGIFVGVIISIICLITVFLNLVSLNSKISENPGDVNNLVEITEIITAFSIPWWLGIFQSIASIGGVFGALMLVGLIYSLKWIGEIN